MCHQQVPGISQCSGRETNNTFSSEFSTNSSACRYSKLIPNPITIIYYHSCMPRPPTSNSGTISTLRTHLALGLKITFSSHCPSTSPLHQNTTHNSSTCHNVSTPQQMPEDQYTKSPNQIAVALVRFSFEKFRLIYQKQIISSYGSTIRGPRMHGPDTPRCDSIRDPR